MSVRRVDDESGFSASSLDASISALADRLPGATRLSHVLAIGAKFKLEQQGKQQQQQQQQQQLQPRKSVFTDAYPRWSSRYAGWTLYERCRFEPGRNSVFRMRLDAYKNAMIAFGNNPTDTNVQQNAINATKDLVAAVMAANIPRRKAIDYLRQEDCYVALNYIVNTYGANAPSHRWAKFMMRESLHHDRTAPYAGHPNPGQEIFYQADGQCRMSRQHLQALGGPAFNYVEANYPPFAGTDAEIEKAQKEFTDEMCMGGLEAEERATDPPILADNPPPQPSLTDVVNSQLESNRNRGAAGPSFLRSDEYLNNKYRQDGRATDRYTREE